jgi:iron complex outermembrane recepter protein
MKRTQIVMLLLVVPGPAVFAEEIIVTATRLEKPLDAVPAAVSVLNAQDVQLARQQIGLDESLAQVPGLFMQDRYNFAQDLRISIRGFGARANFGIRGVRIFVDGIPETLPDGQGQVDSIDLGSVQRITVLRGSASALYGNAAGGVILIDSELPPEQTTIDGRFSLGELGFGKQQLKAGGTSGKLGWLVNLADFEMDGFREQSQVESRSLNGVLRYALSADSNFRAAFNFTDQPTSDDPGALTRAEADANPRQAAPASIDFDGGESLEQQRIGFVYDKSFGEHHDLTARNYYVWRNFENALAFQPGGAVTIDRFFVGGGLMYTNRGNLAGRDNRLMLGVDVDSQRDDRKRFDNNFGTPGALVFSQIEKVADIGVFVQDELALGADTTLTVGARHDRVRLDADDRFLANGDDSGRRTLSQTSPMVGLLHSVSPEVNLYANIGTSFETPTTTELANPAGGGFNPTLDPQLATNYEVGMKGLLAQRNRYSLALFHIDVKDELVPFELAGSPGRSFFRNAGRSTREGIEVGASSEPMEGLTLSLAYTYSDFTFENGGLIPGQPRNVAHGGISWHGKAGLFASLDGLYVGHFFADDANTVRSGDYALANLRLGYSMDRGALRWSVFGGANNLFDESYDANIRLNAFADRYFEPGPPRNTYAGVELKWVY